MPSIKDFSVKGGINFGTGNGTSVPLPSQSVQWSNIGMNPLTGKPQQMLSAPELAKTGPGSFSNWIGYNTTVYGAPGGTFQTASPPTAPVQASDVTPTVTLPEAYQQNNSGAAPATQTPLTIRNGIVMPTQSKGVRQQAFPSMNWTDFLTVAHNSQKR